MTPSDSHHLRLSRGRSGTPSALGNRQTYRCTQSLVHGRGSCCPTSSPTSQIGGRKPCPRTLPKKFPRASNRLWPWKYRLSALRQNRSRPSTGRWNHNRGRCARLFLPSSSSRQTEESGVQITPGKGSDSPLCGLAGSVLYLIVDHTGASGTVMRVDAAGRPMSTSIRYRPSGRDRET